MTPAKYTLPSGWTLIRTQDFESGCGASEACGIRQGFIGTAKPHTGTHSVEGTYSKDADSVGWQLYGGVGSFSEIYVSWYDYTDSAALFNDEYWLAWFIKRTNDGGFQEVIGDFMFSGINKPTGMLQVVPQGPVVENYGPFEAGTMTYPRGQWVQWEIHYRQNTVTNGKANSDGFYRIFLNGILVRNIVNTRLNGFDMSDMTVQVGGDYTKLVWTYKDPASAGASACDVPSQCDLNGFGSDGCRNYMGWENLPFSNPKCGSSLPSFKRYIDDIIVMKKN
jgi:hypothetical protein